MAAELENASAVIHVELTKAPEIHVELRSDKPVIRTEIVGKGPVGERGPQGVPGNDGADGQNGVDGADGVSPTVAIAEIPGGHSVTITDADHPSGQSFNVMDGQNGADGQDGADGADGVDGVSPAVSIVSITGGHSVTITDKDHPSGQSFNVRDGEDGLDGQDGQDGQDGAPGVGVPSGGSAGQVLQKRSATDYDTEWVTPSVGTTDVYWATYGTTTSADIEAAYQAGKIVAVLNSGRVYYLERRDSTTDHFFYAAIDTRFYVCRCTSNSWSNYYYECLELGDTGTIPAGGNAGQILAKNSGTDYDVHWVNKTQDYPSAYCTTAAGTAAKKASCSLYVATANSYLHVLMGAANSYAGAITLNVNSAGAKPIYINGAASSATNYTLPAGSYIVFYDGTNYHFRTDGKIPGILPSDATPSDLGTAAAGSSADFSRADHVHKKPTPSDIGAEKAWVMLWSNPAGSSSFASQTISKNLSNYSFLQVVFAQSTSVPDFLHFVYNMKGKGASCIALDLDLSAADVYVYKRDFISLANNSGILFGDCQKRELGANSGSVDNTNLIPMYILGK